MPTRRRALPPRSGPRTRRGVLDRALAVLSEQETMPLDPVLRFARGGDPDLRMRALSMLHDRGNEDRGCPRS